MSELHPQLVVDGPHRQGPGEVKTIGLDVAKWLATGQAVQSIQAATLTDRTTGLDYTGEGLPAPAVIENPHTITQAIGPLLEGHDYLLEIPFTVDTYEKPVAQLTIECVRRPR